MNRESLKADPEVQIDAIVDVIMKECRKDNIVYKRQALEALGEVLSSLKLDKFEDLYNIVQVILLKVVFVAMSVHIFTIYIFRTQLTSVKTKMKI